MVKRILFSLALGVVLLPIAPAAAQEDVLVPEAEQEPEPEPEAGEPDEGEEPELGLLEAVERRHVVMADLSLGVIAAAYEHVFNENLSLQVAAGLYGPWYRWQDNVIRGFGGELRFFVFMLQPAPAGLYLSPGVRVAWVSAEKDGQSGDGIAWSARLTVGYSIMFAQAVILRLGVGVQGHVVDVEVAGEQQGFAEIYPAADIELGWAFD